MNDEQHRYIVIEKFCAAELVSDGSLFRSSAINRLQQDVTEFINLGWQVQGGVTVQIAPNGSMRCYQAMTHPIGGKLPRDEA